MTSAIEPNSPPVATDECYRCGYVLHGISNDQACPECGLLAERSRRVTDELHNAHPTWLRHLSRGTKLMLLGLTLGCSWPFLVATFGAQVYEALAAKLGQSWTNQLDQLPLVGMDLAVVLFVSGIWLVTRSELRAQADVEDRSRATALRIAALVLLFLALSGHVMARQFSLSDLIERQRDTKLNVSRAVFGSLTIMTVVLLPPLLFEHFREVGRRARSAHLVEHCRIVGIGSSFALTYALVLGFLFAKPILPVLWLASAVLPLILLMIGCVSAALFLLWSWYLLIRFTISFHLAARSLRSKWRRDDRALTSARPGSA